MKRMLFAIVSGGLIAGCASADFIAQNGLRVEPTSATDFTVPYRGLSGESDFWCAAGDYVIRSLNLSPATPIYRTSPPPRRSGEGVNFSLSPEGATRPGVAILSSDLALSASFARNFCEKLLPEFDDF